jgi:drug/metabolite transporter (DMT)-like permease
MTIWQLFLTLFTILLLSIGQILFKYAANKMNIQDKGLLEGLLLNPSFIIALFIYGVATISWMLVLRITPLNIVYPFGALAFIIVPVLAHYFLGESLKWTTLTGAVVIILGVYISLR